MKIDIKLNEPALEGLYEGSEYWSLEKHIAIEFPEDSRLGHRFARYTLFGWDEGSEGRVVTLGPMVPGPYVTMSRKPDVISKSPGIVEKMITANLDDTFIIFGVEWKISVTRGDAPQLVRA